LVLRLRGGQWGLLISWSCTLDNNFA
jgi:hypothetical protein